MQVYMRAQHARLPSACTGHGATPINLADVLKEAAHGEDAVRDEAVELLNKLQACGSAAATSIRLDLVADNAMYLIMDTNVGKHAVCGVKIWCVSMLAKH